MPGIYRNRERDRRFIRPSEELPGYQHAQWEDVTEPVTGREPYIAAGIQPQAAAAAIPQLPPPMAAPMPREARREPPREPGPITDEWEDVSYIEEAPTMPGRVAERWELGQLNVELGLLESQGLLGATSPEIQARIAEIEGLMPRGERRKHTFAERMATESAEMAPTMAEGIKRGVERGVILGGGMAAITVAAGQIPPLTFLPEEFVTVPGAAAAGYTVGMTSAMLESIGRIEAGLAYNEYKNLTDPKTGQKIDPEIARWAALGVGSVNALLELFQIKLLMKAIPGGKTLLRAATNGAVKKVITGTPLKRLAFRASKYASVVGAETLQEIAQEASTMTGQAIATELTNRIKGTKIAHQTKEEIITRLKDVAESSLYAFSLMALPHAGGVRARAAEPTETVSSEHAPVDITAPPKQAEHRRILDKVKADVETGAMDIEQIEGVRDLYRQRYPDKLPEIQELENIITKMTQAEAPEVREGVVPVAVTGELARKPAEEIAEPVPGAIETEEATRQSQEGFNLVQQQLAEEEAIQAAAEQEAVAPIPYEEVYPEVEAAAPEAITPEIEEAAPILEEGREKVEKLPWEGKQGWEMTKSEIGEKYAFTGEVYDHEEAIKQALKEDKKVPAKVLAEYPDLMPVEIPAEEVPSTAAELVDQAAAETETEPTEAQKESGIYKKGHVKLHGLDISIENPIGSVRRGVAAGKAWATTMRHHYGYFPGFEGKDKDHVDVFIGPNPESEHMFVIDQINPKTKAFDEHKVMMGFDTEKQARVAYMSNYEKGWKGLGNITSMTMDEFKNWLKTGDKKKRAVEISKVEVGEYVYHGTSEGAFRQIRKTGLTGKINYFSKDELYAKSYAERKGVLKEPRILRIKKTADIIPDERIPEVGDLKTKRAISPKEIEVKVGKEWIPIQEYYDESINIMPLVPELPLRKPALVPALEEKPKKVVTPIPKEEKAAKAEIAYPAIPSSLEPLIKEAKQYKTFEEWKAALVEDRSYGHIASDISILSDNKLDPESFWKAAQKVKEEVAPPVAKEPWFISKPLKEMSLKEIDKAMRSIPDYETKWQERYAELAEEARKRRTEPTKEQTYEVAGKIAEPKIPYKVTEAAEKILKDLPDLPKDISTAQGKVARAATGVKTLAVGINTEARQTGRIDLRGQKVNTAEDLAVLAQVYRDPRYETLRIFYIKDNVIVAHEGMTSRMPDFAMVFSKRPEFDLNKMRDRMKRLNADSYYLLHNHPSGDPTASENDASLTAAYASRVSGFKGHIIIDSGKYVILGEGYYRMMSTMQGREVKLPDLPTDWKDPLLPGIVTGEKTEVRDPDDVAMLGQSLKTPENYVTLIYRSGTGAVNAIQEMPIKLFSNVKEASNYIRGRMRNFGAGQVFAYLDSLKSIRELFIAEPSPINQLIENGTLFDAVYSVSGLPMGISQRAEFRKKVKPGMVAGVREKEMPTLRVAEADLKWAKEYIEKALRPKKVAIKKRIRLVTGQVKVGDLIREEVALKASMKKAAQAARVAYREATREATAKEKAKGKVALEALRKSKLAMFAKEKARIKELGIKARERKKLRTAINKMIKHLKAIDVEKMSPQEAEPIRDLLADIDLVRMNKKTKLKLSRTRDYFENNPEVELPDYMLERVSRLDKQNLNDITFDELHSIYTAVMHYAHLNKVKNKIKVGRERKRAAEVLQGSIAEMKPAKEIENNIIASQRGGFKGVRKVGRLLKDTFGIRHDHFDLIIESLSGTNSIMDKVLYQGVKEGITKQLKYKQDVYSQFNEDLGNFDERYKIDNIATWLEEEVRTGSFNLTRGERMALYRHSFNADNRRAIIEGGFGFKSSTTPNKVHNMTEAELEEILKSLTPAEKAFAGKAVENLFETQSKELDKVFYEKNGYPMPKEANYYPKEVMPLTRGKDIEKEEALERFKGKWMRIGLEKGMLKRRKRVKNPIYLNSISYDLNKSVMKSAAYVGLELPLSNASKLLYNRNFRRELTNRYGTQTWKEIEKGLRDIAGDWQSYTTTEELLLKTKNNLSVAFLGVNPFVMAKQVLSFSVYLPYIKPLYLMQGMLDYISHPMELKERHKMYSPEYLERVEGGYSRDVADIFKKGAEKRLYAGKKTIKEKFMGGIKLFDSAAVTPGMQGAVLQVLDEFSQGKLSREVKIALDMENSDIARLTAQDRMRLAYKFADYATERTQPMFSPEHRSSLSRGASVEKLGTMFGSFTNQALNLMRRSFREGRRTGDPAAYRKFAQSLFVVMILNTLGVMLIDDIRDRLYGRKREGIVGGILGTWSGYMFFVRDLASSVISKIERGTFLGYDVEWPISRVPELLSNVIANGVGAITEKGEKRKKNAFRFIDDSLNLVLTMTGIPYQTPKRLAGVGTELVRYRALPIKKKVATEQFVEEWVKAKKGRDRVRFRELKLKVDDYNKLQRRKGKKGEPIKWTSIAQKGINIMKAEVKAQKLARR